MTRAVTPGRRFFPGHWDHNERAVPDTQILEMDCDIGLDPNRVIAAPVQSPEDRIFLARVRRWAVARAVGASAALAGLLALFGAHCFKS